MSKQEKKEYLAQLNFCRSFLYLGNMLSDKENGNVHKKIHSYQNRNKIEISPLELRSVEIIYELTPDNKQKTW